MYLLRKLNTSNAEIGKRETRPRFNKTFSVAYKFDNPNFKNKIDIHCCSLLHHELQLHGLQ